MTSPGLLIDERFGPAIPEGLTQMPSKTALYALDTHFWEGWEDLAGMAADSAGALARSHALLLVRPDAFAARKVEALLQWLPQNGFSAVASAWLDVSSHQACALWRYQWNTAPRVRREALTAVLGAAASLLLVIRSTQAGELPATTRFARLKGPADPALRRPGDLRAVLGSPAHLISYVHAADDAADLLRELAILLPECERRSVFAAMRDGAGLCAEELLAAVRAACERVPRHSFALAGAVERLGAAVRAQLPAGDPDRAAVTHDLDQLLAGSPLDWRRMFRILDASRVSYDRWDRIAVMGHASDVSYEGLIPLIPGVAVSA